MTDDFTTDSLQYLLNEMEPARRAAFEQRLSRDPLAAATFKQYADQYAHFAVEVAPPIELSAAERQTSLSAVLAEASLHPATKPAPLVAFPHWAWPAAAAILLLFNLLQLTFRPSSTSTAGVIPPGTARAPDSLDASPRPVLTQSDPTSPRAKDAAVDSFESGKNGGSASRYAADVNQTDPDERLTTELSRLDELRRDYAALQRARDTLNSEYNLALQELTRRALTEQGVGRLAAMELVDANSYARGDRRGLMNLARGLLTEPGIVAVEPSSVKTGNELVLSASVNITQGSPTTAFPLGFSSVDSLTPPGKSPPNSESGFASTGQPISTSTYAWSVFDEKQNQGYLNLYNLPQVSNNQTLQVWVKPVNSAEFRPVGEVPAQFYGRSGSVHYELPATVATPAEVLITLEPKAPVPSSRPTGAVILRGP